MSDKLKYIETQNTILSACKAIRFLDIEWFLTEIKKAHTMAPIIDPTAYKAALKNLGVVEKSALAMLKAQKELPDIEDVIEGLISARKYNERDKDLLDREIKENEG